MHTEYKKEYSNILGRDIEFKIYGHTGKPCLVFSPQDGRFHNYEDFEMVQELSDYIERGELQLFCVDSVDRESWSHRNGDPRQRIELQEKWFEHIVNEMIPLIQNISGRNDLIVTGCSMGGAHAGIVFFRRPDLFDTLISLSGAFDASMFFGDYMDNLVYDNSPVHFLRNMPEDHHYIKLYRNKNIIICIGQGAWEGELLPSNRELKKILEDKKIPAWIDFWGYDVAHDWDWWKKQIRYFMSKILN